MGEQQPEIRDSDVEGSGKDKEGRKEEDSKDHGARNGRIKQEKDN